MAAQIALTEQQLQQQIHVLYEGNTSYPSNTDDDYLSRRVLMNDAVMQWDMFEGTLWNELWTPSSSGDGQTTILSNTTSYSLPSDFRFMAGYLRLIDSNGVVTFYKKIKAEDADKYEGQTALVFYVTGSANAGYKLNFLAGSGSSTFPTSQVGQTIKYEYYKRPSYFSAVGNIPDMSDPSFIIHHTLAYLYRQDDNDEAFQSEMQIANSALQAMRTVNMMASWREDDHIKDGLFDDQGFPGFGR